MKRIAVSLIAAASLALPAFAGTWDEPPIAPTVEQDVSAVMLILYAHPFGICEGNVCSLNEAGTAKLLYQTYNRRLSETRSQALKQRVLAGLERVRGIPWAAAEHQAEADALKSRAEELERRVEAVETVLLDKDWAAQWRGGEIRYEFQEGVDWKRK